MSTKTVPGSHATIERYRQIVSGSLELVIDDAVAYWLEDDSGKRLSPEAIRTIEPLARVLQLVESGTNPDALLLCARLDTGERYEIGSGLSLIDIAEAAAGIPARPRALREP